MTIHQTFRRVSFLSTAVSLLLGCAVEHKSERKTARHEGLTSSTLPDGTLIEVGIDSPTNGAVVPSGPLNVTGTAQIGEETVDTDLVLIMDISGSTTNQGTGCGLDQNGDGLSNTVLDCEISALIAVVDAVDTAGSVQQLGLGVFSQTGQTADVSPSAGTQLLTPPGADNDGMGGRDIDQVLRSATPGNLALFSARTVNPNFTSFSAGLGTAPAIFAAGGASDRKVLIFISDGGNNTGPNVNTVTGSFSNTTAHLIAAGPSSNCANDGFGFGSMNSIVAQLNAGSGNVADCTNVPSVADLPNVIPDLIRSQMTSVTLSVDGGAAVAVDSISPSLPQDGPATFTWSTTVNGLSAGLHELCATANGTDHGGDGSVTDCVTIRVNNPPQAICQNLTLNADLTCGANGSVDNGSFDPDGDAINCVQAPAGPYALGTTGVTLTCTDPFGASDACTATVTVIDVTPPDITCPANQTAECVDGAATVDFGNATATDNCGIASVACVPPSGSSFDLGTTPVACTATDTSSNSSVCGFDVAVVDTTPPVVTVGGGGELWPPNHKYVTLSLSDCGIEIDDQCQGMIDLEDASPIITCVTSDEVENSAGDGNTSGDMVIVDATTVNLRSERSGTLDGRVYGIHFNVTDAQGNTTSAVCPVSVPHDQGGGSVAVNSGVHFTVGTCN